MKNKKLIIAVIAAALTLCSCGAVSGETAAEDEKETKPSAEQTAEVQQDTEPQTGESDTVETDESTQDTDVSDETGDPDDESSDTDPQDESADGQQSGGYYNAEFGFTLPLPEGTEYNEFEDVLKPSFDDDEVEFRALMETVSSDSFNISVQLLETAKTLDDFAKDRWEYADNVNNAGEEQVTILDTSNAPIGGRSAQVITEKLEGANGTFYTLRVYIQTADGQYIYIQGNCFDLETLAHLEGCAESLYFS